MQFVVFENILVFSEKIGVLKYFCFRENEQKILKLALEVGQAGDRHPRGSLVPHCPSSMKHPYATQSGKTAGD